uniref:hypothetical protein n=1 Tax=Enterocloster clostridioformis TaxID=1531 RepID=UPI002ED3B8FB
MKPVRQKWFACACCPPNIARLIGGLWQYVYTADRNNAYVHLYVGSYSSICLEKGRLDLVQETDYPWDDKVRIKVKADTRLPLGLALRIPGWSRGYSLRVNGETVSADNGAYLDQIAVDPKGGLAEEADLSMPGGCIALKARGVRELAQTDADTLYMPYGSYEEAVTVKAVPYFLWNNRGRGEMQVWMRMK